MRKIYKHIQSREIKLDSTPYDIGVIIDHQCNLRCKMCFIFSNPGYVVADGFYKIVDEIHMYLKQIYLIGGEPFFSKRSVGFINHCINRNYKFKFGFITNLTIFDRELLSKIDIDGFCVSTDAATKETYEKIRKGANWEKLMHNLKELIKFELLSKKHFEIKVAFLVMTSNFREIPMAIELFEPMGVALEFPPIIQVAGDPENIFEKTECHDEFLEIIAKARKLTHQNMVLNSLNVLEQIING